MNALSLYVTTCRMIFQADINNAGSMKDINRLIMYLRQSLSCIVCNQLLKIPMSSSVAICQHHVCKSCIGGKMRLKPSCTWCKDYSKFIENVQLRILLQCYKRLTIYLKKSEISKKWATLQTGNTPGVLIGSSANSNYNQCPSNFKDLINEGSNLQDNKYTFFEPPSLRNLNKSSSQQNNSSTTNSSSIDSLDNSKLIHLNASNIKTILDKDDIINKSSQATIVRLTTRDNTISNQLINNSSLNHHLNNLQTNLTSSSLNHSSTSITPSKSKNKVRKGCRCGLATLNPGKLTCCGQRCPCYVNNKPCNGCKCRGCKNTKILPENGNNNSTNSNLITNRSSPNYINTSSTINNQNNHIITNNTSNLLSTSPNLFTTSSPSNLQLNNLNQATLISSTSTRNLLSPSFLLSSPAATINAPSSTANLISNNSMFSTTSNTSSGNNKINISSSASPSAAILLHNNVSTVGCESLTLPFPNIENILSEENVCNIEEEQSLHHQIINEIDYNE